MLIFSKKLNPAADKLGLPYLSAYLDAIGANFRHGANFATSGSTIQPLDMRIFQGGFSPISLDIQLQQFEQLKARTLELHHEGANWLNLFIIRVTMSWYLQHMVYGENYALQAVHMPS